MSPRPDIVERLMVFWSASAEGRDGSDPLCRELARELAQVIPRSLLAVLQSEPCRHREAIEDVVLSQLGLTHRMLEDSRKPVACSPLPPRASPGLPVSFRSQGPDTLREADSEPLRKSQLSGTSLSQKGDGIQFATGDINGGFNLTTGAQPTGPGRPEPSGKESLLDADDPIRVLFLGSNPDDSLRLRLDQEVREIDRALASAALGHRFQLTQKWAVRSSELQSHLLRCKPHILHFSGHGTRDKRIILESDDGTSQAIDGQRLARLLGQFNQNLRCVFLNACYSEKQAHAIAQEIDCVVGMATAVEDEAAIRFAAVFYEALASGYDVRAAFDLGRADVVVGEMRQDAVPQLVVRRRAAETIRFAPPTQP